MEIHPCAMEDFLGWRRELFEGGMTPFLFTGVVFLVSLGAGLLRVAFQVLRKG
jgi:hypothetical protein